MGCRACDQVVVDRCTTQLAMLDTLQARRRRDMGKRVDTADQAAVKALAEQLQALKVQALASCEGVSLEHRLTRCASPPGRVCLL